MTETAGVIDSQRSSCEVKTSTRGYDITVKVYDGSSVTESCHLAVAHYWATWDEMQAELLHRTAA